MRRICLWCVCEAGGSRCKFPAAAATPAPSKPVPAAKMDGPPAAGLGASAAAAARPISRLR